MMKTEPWIQTLLDIGIGKLATDTLYRMKNKIFKSPICDKCGTIPGKHASNCPVCRKPLPWVKDIGGKIYVIKDP